MSIWMYHTLTKSVFPVPANTVEEAAVLADKLSHRIYFEAELTTQPLEFDEEWWVKIGRDWKWFFLKEEAEAYITDKGDGQLYLKQTRLSEVFLTKQEL